MKRSIKYLRIACLFAACFAGCNRASKTTSSDRAGTVLSINPSAITSCPYLTHNTMGIPVISWIQQDSMHGMNMGRTEMHGMDMQGMSTDESGSIYYAVFSDSSKTFGKPMLIPSTKGAEVHGEDAPKILFQKDGTITVVFAVKNPHPGNPYTGAVYYTQSFDNGKSWSSAKPLIKDTAMSYDQRYFDIASLPDGKAAVIWLNNSKPQGSTLYFATLGSKGLDDPVIISRHTCQCCRTDILVDSSGRINIAWRDIYQDSIRDMMYAYSDDMGKTFSKPVRISADNWVVDGCPHTGPSMAENKDGLHFTWFTMGGGSGIFYCETNDQGKTFSHRQLVNDLPSSRHPQIAVLPDDDLAIVWDGGVTNQNKVNQRIGLQMRGPHGLLLGTRYLTSDTVNADFPVIKVLNNKSAIVAYSQSEGSEMQVKYQIISLKL